MKSQMIGLLLHSILLGLCLLGGVGVEVAENLFSSGVVILSLLWWLTFCVSHSNGEVWKKRAPGSKASLRFVIRLLIGLQVLSCFGFGWFWVGGLHFVTTLVMTGRQMQARSNECESA